MGNCSCIKVREQHFEHSQDVLDRMDDFLSELDSYSDAAASDGRSVGVDAIGEAILGNISFEGEVSTLDHIYVEDECCCICSFQYDDVKHFPRILPCGHTICDYCVGQISRKSKFKYLKCPMDRKRHKIKQQQIGEVSDVKLTDDDDDDDDDDADGGAVLSDGFDDRIDIYLEFLNNADDDGVDRSLEILNNEDDTGAVDENDADDRTLSEMYEDIIGRESLSGDITDPDFNLEDLSSLISQEDTYSPSLISLYDQQLECRGQQSQHSMATYKPNSFYGNNAERGTKIMLLDGQSIKFSTIQNTRDVYDDERSIRSFEWVDPDYPSD